MQLRRGHPQEGGLPGAVAAEDHPALVEFDAPVHPIEQLVAAPAHADVGHVHHKVVDVFRNAWLAHAFILSSAPWARANRGCRYGRSVRRSMSSGAGVVTERTPSVSALSS